MERESSLEQKISVLKEALFVGRVDEVEKLLEDKVPLISVGTLAWHITCSCECYPHILTSTRISLTTLIKQHPDWTFIRDHSLFALEASVQAITLPWTKQKSAQKQGEVFPLEGSRTTLCVLRPEVAQQIETGLASLNEKQNQNNLSPEIPHAEKQGRRLVLHLNYQTHHMHFKIYPELPGYEYAAGQFHELFFENKATPQTEFFRLGGGDTGLPTVPILFSETIEGDNLEDLLKHHPEEAAKRLALLDPMAFTELLFGTLLLWPEDGKPDNFKLNAFQNRHGQTAYRLICVDNDHLFIEPFESEMTDKGIVPRLRLKSIVLCLDAMQQPLNREAVQRFCQQPILTTLKIWLEKLKAEHAHHERLFASKGDKVARDAWFENAKQATKWSPNNNTPPSTKTTLVGLPFQPRTISKLYQRLQDLQKRLANVPPETTGLVLLNIFLPQVGDVCTQAFTDFDNPRDRFFNGVAKDQYVQQNSGNTTMSTMSNLLSLQDIPKTAFLGQHQDYTPERFLKELDAVQIEYQRYALVQIRIQAGEYKAFEELYSRHYRQKIMNNLEYTTSSNVSQPKKAKPFSLIAQQKWFDYLVTQDLSDFQKFRIIGASQLTDSHLKRLLQKMPNLESLHLEGCALISTESISLLGQLTPRLQTFVLKKVNLTQLVAFDRNFLGFSGNLKSLTLPHLETLVLENCPVLAHFWMKPPKHLRHFTLRGCPKLEPEPVVEFLRQLLPLSRLTLDEVLDLRWWRPVLLRHDHWTLTYAKDLIQEFGLLHNGCLELSALSGIKRLSAHGLKICLEAAEQLGLYAKLDTTGLQWTGAHWAVLTEFAKTHALSWQAPPDYRNLVSSVQTLNGDRRSGLRMLSPTRIVSGSSEVLEEQGGQWNYVATLREDSEEVYTLVALSSTRVVSSSKDGTLKIWEERQSKWHCVATIKRVGSLLAVLSSTRVVSAIGGTLNVLEEQEDQWRCVATLEGYDKTICVLAALSSTRAVSASEDTIKILEQQSDRSWVLSYTVIKSIDEFYRNISFHEKLEKIRNTKDVIKYIVNGSFTYHWRNKINTLTRLSSTSFVCGSIVGDEKHILYPMSYIWEQKSDHSWVLSHTLSYNHFDGITFIRLTATCFIGSDQLLRIFEQESSYQWEIHTIWQKCLGFTRLSSRRFASIRNLKDDSKDKTLEIWEKRNGQWRHDAIALKGLSDEDYELAMLSPSRIVAMSSKNIHTWTFSSVHYDLTQVLQSLARLSWIFLTEQVMVEGPPEDCELLKTLLIALLDQPSLQENVLRMGQVVWRFAGSHIKVIAFLKYMGAERLNTLALDFPLWILQQQDIPRLLRHNATYLNAHYIVPTGSQLLPIKLHCITLQAQKDQWQLQPIDDGIALHWKGEESPTSQDLVSWSQELNDYLAACCTQDMGLTLTALNSDKTHWQVTVTKGLHILWTALEAIACYRPQPTPTSSPIPTRFWELGFSAPATLTVKPDLAIDPLMIHYGQELGRGAYAKVLKAEWQGKTVAVKKMLKGNKIDPNKFQKVQKSFAIEIELLTRCQSPFIIGFYGASLDKDFFVLEWAMKGSLETLLLDSNELLPWEIRYLLASDIARALQYLHGENIFHSDLKTENVLVTAEYRGKLSDFGVSKEEGCTTQDIDVQDIKGTVPWMAPEQLLANSQGKVQHSRQTDVWSYAMILLTLATRKAEPWDGKSRWEIENSLQQDKRPLIPSTCPKGFAQLITLGWARDPIKRPTAVDAVRQIELVATGQPLDFRP